MILNSTTVSLKCIIVCGIPVSNLFPKEIPINAVKAINELIPISTCTCTFYKSYLQGGKKLSKSFFPPCKKVKTSDFQKQDFQVQEVNE